MVPFASRCGQRRTSRTEEGMPRPFPTQPNLEHFRKQAKQLLRDVRAGDGDATRRARLSHPRWSAGVGMQRGLSLHDAQLVSSMPSTAASRMAIPHAMSW